MTGNLKDLTERLREKAEADRKLMETTIADELRNWRETWRRVSTDALATTQKDMERLAADWRRTAGLQMKLLSWSFVRRWLMTGALALAVTLGLASGAGCLMKLAEARINSLRRELAELNSETAKATAAWRQIQSQTWGLTLSESPEGRFIILPPGANLKTGWIVGNRPAVKVE